MSLVIVFLTHNFHPSINMMIYIVPQEKKRKRERGWGKRRSGKKKLTWWREEPITYFSIIFIK